jgi:hypothetical protein
MIGFIWFGVLRITRAGSSKNSDFLISVAIFFREEAGRTCNGYSLQR